MGVHQKIDRIARRDLAKHIPKRSIFPSEHQILHFEGLNGPDGIKRKSPARDEPWHYIDPHNPGDHELRDMMEDHLHNLVDSLVDDNRERAAFEAAWLAHAITDGLTPAHHYPLEEKLEELRDGEGIETRISAKDKLLLPGKTLRQRLRNNWEFWGAKGVMTTHLAFELGEIRRAGEFVDVDARVHCSSGTYIRSLGRDLGAALGVGGHLIALRRSRVGSFSLTDARTLEQLEDSAELSLSLDEALTRAWPVLDVTAKEYDALAMGKWLEPRGLKGVHAAVGPDGRAVALVKEKGKRLAAVFVARPSTL